MEQQQTTIPKVHATVEVDKDLVLKVDELGALGEKIVKAKKLIAEYEKLRKEVVSIASKNVAPEDATQVIGEAYVVKLTAQTLKRDIINKQAIFDAVGNDTFVELASFRLTDLDKYLTPAQLEKAVAEIHAGPRRVSTVKRDA